MIPPLDAVAHELSHAIATSPIPALLTATDKHLMTQSFGTSETPDLPPG